MKICIYSTPRSGSTSLFNYLKLLISEIGLKSYFEPFSMHGNKNRKYNSVVKFDNLLIKNIIYQLPTDIKNINDFDSKIINDFDKIIVLLRKDIKAQAESYTYRGSKHFMQQCPVKYGRGSWQTKSIYKFDDSEIGMIEENEKTLLENTDHLIKFATENNLFIIHLEDILDKNEVYYNMLEYVGYSHIDTLYDSILSKEHKLRIEPIKKLL
jgi:hypothetical protein